MEKYVAAGMACIIQTSERMLLSTHGLLKQDEKTVSFQVFWVHGPHWLGMTARLHQVQGQHCAPQFENRITAEEDS